MTPAVAAFQFGSGVVLVSLLLQSRAAFAALSLQYPHGLDRSAVKVLFVCLGKEGVPWLLVGGEENKRYSPSPFRPESGCLLYSGVFRRLFGGKIIAAGPNGTTGLSAQ